MRRLLLAVASLLAAVPGVAPGDTPEGGYVGSAACKGCHTYLYDRWRTTRHSFSVRTADEARQAGYPLPQPRRGGQPATIESWSDVSYVIGGRQRIAYADRRGLVQDSSFHHRVGRWDVFPSLGMPVCARCHYTGVGAGPAHPDNPALPGRWAERNIGCEACHGPGGRHVETLERSDIVKDPSSRVCGQCHTAVGKILPKGELHDTHDLVQIWNQDPHVTGVARHSHNAFCSRCHSPYDGYFLETGEGAQRKVFTEHKLNITCIGCHDPHSMTRAPYGRGTVSLAPPLPVKSHTFKGNDADFTTTDHQEWDDAAQGCVSCHRGADRIDLDHANATCVDCHNTFNRNHTRESRQFHDANEPRLSCRGCHANADHLMSILFQDPDFLEPRLVHNLRTLPDAVRMRYGFRYPDLRASATVASVARPPAARGRMRHTPALEPTAGARHARSNEPGELDRLLTGGVHAVLAGEPAVARVRDALLKAPGSVARHLQLAEAYAERGEFGAVRELLRHAFAQDSSRLLLELPLSPGTAAVAVAGRGVELLPDAGTVPADEPHLRLWLQAYLQLANGNFSAALQALEGLPRGAAGGAYAALAELGQGHYRRAREVLEANIKAYPEHHLSHAALGLVHVLRRRSVPAIAALERAIALAPGEGSAHLLLGEARASAGKLEQAVAAFKDAVAVEPGLLEAGFALARVYHAGGRPDAAARVYQELIDLEPRLFEARYLLASVLKLLSDGMAFALEGDRESNPPPGISDARWRSRLASWEEQIARYRNLALVELAAAARLQPTALDTFRQVAEIYRRSGRLEEAARFYGWLARREPGVWMHAYRLGTIQIAQGRHSQAIRTLRQVIARAPADGDAYVALGLALVRDGRLDEAIAVFEKATVYEPFNPGLYTNLGAAYASRGEFGRARRALERSLELHSFPLPRVHLTQTNLALVHVRVGRRQEAVLALRRALHRHAGHGPARDLLARLTADPAPPAGDWPAFVYNDWLERFGEVTTVVLGNEASTRRVAGNE